MLLYRKVRTLLYPNQTPDDALFLPYAQIDRAIRLRRPTREEYTELRTLFTSWLRSLYGENYWEVVSRPGVNSMEFVDYQLTHDQKEEALSLLAEGIEPVLEQANALMLNGYRFTFTYDRKNDCVIVSIMGKEKDNVNYGKCMTSRHRDVEHALAIAVYKQSVIFQTEAWSESRPEERYG